MMIRTALVALLSLAVPRILAQDCKLPSWTLKDIKIKTFDAVGNSGSASFTLVPSDTGKGEPLTCARLQGNYRCAVKSKVDPSLEVDLQINLGVAYMSVTQLKFSCGSATASIAGRTEIDLACTEAATRGAEISCTSEVGGTIQAVLI